MPRLHIRVGHSPDPDDAFMYWALTTDLVDTRGHEFEQVLGDIETLNQWARAARLETTAISLAAYPFVQEDYALLPHGASIGSGYGPIVVARQPMSTDALAQRVIAIPGYGTTAYLLLRLALGDPPVIVVAFDQIPRVVAEGQADAGLLIHEGQITYAAMGLSKVLDLGELWTKRTGLPLPLGVNVTRRDLGEDMAKVRSALSGGYFDWLRRIAAGQLRPELICRFWQNSELVNRLRKLPPQDQRKLAGGGRVPVVVTGPDGKTDVRNLSVEEIRDGGLMNQVFASDHIRDEGAQANYLDNLRREAAKPKPEHFGSSPYKEARLGKTPDHKPIRRPSHEEQDQRQGRHPYGEPQRDAAYRCEAQRLEGEDQDRRHDRQADQEHREGVDRPGQVVHQQRGNGIIIKALLSITNQTATGNRHRALLGSHYYQPTSIPRFFAGR